MESMGDEACFYELFIFKNVDCCKKKEMPADMQQLMKENVFK